MAPRLSSASEQMPQNSLVLLGMAIVLTLLGIAGFVPHSFAYPLALLLAALFGISGAASLMARSSRQRSLLVGIAMAVALAVMYVFLVSGGGPPPPTPSR